MKRSNDRILTTHVGSLIRPPEIIDAMRKATAHLDFDDEDYRNNLTKAVKEIVRKQAKVGLDVPSDGEFGKRGWIRYVIDRFSGLDYRPDTKATGYSAVVYYDRDRFKGFFSEYLKHEDKMWLPPAREAVPEPAVPERFAWHNTGKIRYKSKEPILRDIANFKAALQDAVVTEAFLPCVAPCSVEVIPHNPDIYKNEEEYLSDIADALNHEYRAIVDAGLILQLDDAVLAMHYNPNGRLDDYLKWAALRVEASNQALKGIPQDRVRYHVCWGSQNAPHTWDIPLKDVVALLLKLNVGALSIEAANPRHEHEWKVWESVKLPADRILIPGMVSHSTNVVEHPELIAWRIGNFASVVGRENIIASTDCGFSQSWNLIRTHPEVQWAKLEALVEGARLASRQLWHDAV
jgi:5-methyltetrahydropteroyltriglutamate--homocysteine methyltransferase